MKLPWVSSNHYNFAIIQVHVYIPAIHGNQCHWTPGECQTIDIIQVHVYIPAVYKKRPIKTKWISNYRNNTGACLHPCNLQKLNLHFRLGESQTTEIIQVHVYIPATYKNQSYEKPCECQIIENNTGACLHPCSLQKLVNKNQVNLKL